MILLVPFKSNGELGQHFAPEHCCLGKLALSVAPPAVENTERESSKR